MYVLKSELAVFQNENDPDLILKLLQLLLTKARASDELAAYGVER